MRRYWLPAVLSSEISAPDAPPVRVQLLGEHLVAFRDTRGRVGLIDEFCAHRRASLFLGRNEDGGLRCAGSPNPTKSPWRSSFSPLKKPLTLPGRCRPPTEDKARNSF